MSEIKERPIIFSAPMVRAILDGRKTQTRRVVRPQPSIVENGVTYLDGHGFGGHGSKDRIIRCPYGVPGDRLWVREGLQRYNREPATAQYRATMSAVVGGPARDGAGRSLWTWSKPSLPSIHMPRWASRLTLDFVSVRVERVQEISEENARAEGFEAIPEQRWWQGYRRAESIHPDALIHQDVPGDEPPEWMIEPKPVYGRGGYDILYPTAARQFQNTWDSINGKKPGCLWADNPWCWVIEFKRVSQ